MVEITANTLFVNEIHLSGCYVLVMSMSGPLGGDSGQNMDKSETPSGNNTPTPSSSTNDNSSPALPPPPRTLRRQRKQMKKEKWDEEQREIDRLVLEAHSRLPRLAAKCFGVIYARYSSNFQSSLVDQVRELLEYAVEHGIFVARECVFCDAAVSGRKRNRPGLLEMKASLSQRHVKVLLVFTTNRLYRKGSALEVFVDEEVLGEKKRAVFVKNVLDTSNTAQWRWYLKMLSMIDEAACTMYAPNIRAAHGGLFRAMLVCGNITFGYMGVPIPGVFTKRNKPRQQYAINDAEAAVVRLVFHWFVNERLPIEAIVKRLNSDDKIPFPRINPEDRWTRQSVRGILENTRYRGLWRYGVTEQEWQAKQDYSKAIFRDRPLEEVQWEELRIVPDELWYAAQDLLVLNEQKWAANRPKHGNARSRMWILNGLFYCAVHDRPLCGSTSGKYLFCLGCKGEPKDRRPLYSGLPRDLALKLTLKALLDLVRGDHELTKRIISACQDASRELQLPKQDEKQQLESRKKWLDGQIGFILRNAGDSDEDRSRSELALAEHRNELRDITMQLGRIASARLCAPRIPTEAEVTTMLESFEEVLCSNSLEESEDMQYKMRELLRSLTGGRIKVVQAGEKRKRHGWVRGRFTPSVVAHVSGALSGSTSSVEPPTAELSIDYRVDTPSLIEERDNRVAELHAKGLQMKEIGKILDLPNPNTITQSLKRWCKRNGVPYPDNGSRYGAMRRADPNGALYKRLAPVVIPLVEEGLKNHEIAQRLGRSKDLITNVLKHYDSLHGTKYCDRKTRYKMHKRRPDPDQAA